MVKLSKQPQMTDVQTSIKQPCYTKQLKHSFDPFCLWTKIFLEGKALMRGICEFSLSVCWCAWSEVTNLPMFETALSGGPTSELKAVENCLILGPPKLCAQFADESHDLGVVLILGDVGRILGNVLEGCHYLRVLTAKQKRGHLIY